MIDFESRTKLLKEFHTTKEFKEADPSDFSRIHIAWLTKKVLELRAAHEESPATLHNTASPNISQLYDELLYAVGNKYPGESRHQTALRYIQQAESNSNIGCDVAKQSGVA